MAVLGTYVCQVSTWAMQENMVLILHKAPVASSVDSKLVRNSALLLPVMIGKLLSLQMATWKESFSLPDLHRLYQL